jgi:DNA repair protein RecN (Recombination protein N)
MALRSLTIQNLTTIESLKVAFEPGLNALTGETGAGKSIVIEGLGLALGARASGDAIRPGARLAVVEAVFEGPFPEALNRLIGEELGLIWEAGEALTLRREVAAGGRNRCLVADQLVGVADLARLGELLIDFHGQHDHQSLMRKGAAREALDAYAGNEALIETYAAAWETVGRLERRQAEMEAAARDFQQRADYLDFQLEELDKLNPRPGEMAELEQEERRLAGAESLAQAAGEAYGLLYDGLDEQPALLALLKDVQRRVAALGEVEPSFAEALGRLEEQKAGLEDLAYALRDYAETTQADPQRLNEAIERREALKRLTRKHGGSEEGLQEAWRAMREERRRMDLDREESGTIAARLAEGRRALLEAGKRLSQARGKAAGRFAKEAAARLAELNMEKARFDVRLEKLAEPMSHGLDEVDFLLAANPGLPPAPLRKVGSGGELSRVMLALKSTLAARDRIPTLVFDEIDTGVSGETARRVGGMLEKLGDSHQILCITHHAPIAARAGHHVSVRKRAIDGATFTEVVALDKAGRLEELARMMGGEGSRTAARKLARELMGAGTEE